LAQRNTPYQSWSGAGCGKPLEVLRVLDAVLVELSGDLQLVGHVSGVHEDAVVVSVRDRRVRLLAARRQSQGRRHQADQDPEAPGTHRERVY
jgi:hypothetical protein